MDTMARERKANLDHSGLTGRAVAATLLTLALLTMPVSYRAGTDVSHAHSFFQYLSDAASSSMDHHRHRGADHDGHSRVESPQRVSRALPGTPAIEPLKGAVERATVLGLVLIGQFACGNSGMTQRRPMT